MVRAGISGLRQDPRTTKGQSLLELACGLMVLIPLFLFCIDVATIYLGVTMNAQICRDAARAASMGAPDAITSGEPRKRAESVVRKCNKANGTAVVLEPDVVCTENVKQPLPANPFGGPVDGDVTIQTTVDIYPPFLTSIFVGPGGLKFTTSQTIPYTWRMPPAFAYSGGVGGGGGGGVGGGGKDPNIP